MFGLDLPQLLLLALIGFVCVGPERLPTFARDAGRMLRQLRQMADGASAELRSQLPDAAEYGLDNVQSLRDLHPKHLIGKVLLDAADAADPVAGRASVVARDGGGVGAGGGAGGGALGAPSFPRTPVVRAPGAPPPYDLDAT